ncbi:HD-GYP domain-containing protein [Lignipirellula cremea]|uniref:Cyclic di-GMP phosphodiesterase response regulator RpfG n=1 Tax=Lignipirellula cremea TaxID=2528010 RepID=A0A518DZA7_9BACT|nr:HD domain-containing phosphohydrolase [Lignipirellula cremea]QDU97178.1 Cyclic di-GMP phosphodiesterase response regulator RpfG [Lignipirellula cremea]
MLKSASLDALHAGTVLGSAVYDARRSQVMLLPAGTAVTESTLEQLAQRGITSIVIDSRDTALGAAFQPHGTETRDQQAENHFKSLLQTVETCTLDEAAAAPGALLIPPRDAPFEEGIQATPVRAPDPAAARELNRQHENNVGFVGKLHDAVCAGSKAAIDAIGGVAQQTLENLAGDRDLFVSLGANPLGGNYPARHCLHVAGIAAAIGCRLGYDQSDLRELAGGCILHDLGMLKLRDGIADAKRRLAPADRAHLAEHPILCLQQVGRNFGRWPIGSLFVAYQLHERQNGSGYPRGRVGEEIHPFARLAAIADAFVGMVSPRPHREAMTPYHAIKSILIGVRNGAFDSAGARALLETVSLFPLGSYVKTNDQRVGRVIRANRSSYTRPIVELWTSGSTETSIVDLQQTPDLRITPLAGLA